MAEHSDVIRQRIQDRAFEIYEWRVENEQPGSAQEDWLEAEEEVLEQVAMENPRQVVS